MRGCRLSAAAPDFDIYNRIKAVRSYAPYADIFLFGFPVVLVLLLILLILLVLLLILLLIILFHVLYPFSHRSGGIALGCCPMIVCHVLPVLLIDKNFF